MRIRRKQVVALTLAMVAVLAVYGIVRSSTSRDARPKDFLEEVHELAKKSAPTEGRGTLPPIFGDASEVPKAEVEPTGTLDFGVIPREGFTYGEIKIHNRGGARLTVSQVSSACMACTYVSMDEPAKLIPPGGTSIIKVRVDPRHIPGFESSKTITIMCDDPKNAKIEVIAKAKVDPEFQVEPPQIDFGEIRKGTPSEKTIVLRQVSNEPIEVTNVGQSDQRNNLVLSFAKRPENEWAAPGMPEYLISVKLSDEISPGAFLETLVITSTCKRLPNFHYTVKGTVTSFYKLSSQVVVLSYGPSPGPKKTPNAITVSADRAIEILDIQPSLEEIIAVSKPGADPNTAIIEFALKPDGKPGRRNGTVGFTVKSGEETLKERLEVRVFASRSSMPPLQLPAGQQPAVPLADTSPQ